VTLSPEAAVYAGRARRSRDELAALLHVVPEPDWPRRAAGDDWDIHTHVAHVVAADAAAARLFTAVTVARGAVTLAESAMAFLEERATQITARRELAPPALRAALHEEREAALSALAALPPPAFEHSVVIPGAGAWGQEAALSLRSYIATWASHDLDHAAAIRAALLTAPSPSAMALAARLQRRG
jgi:hypothetical protein